MVRRSCLAMWWAITRAFIFCARRRSRRLRQRRQKLIGLIDRPHKKTTTKKAKHYMRAITKTLHYLQLPALPSTVASPGPEAAHKQVPFHGTIQTLETVESVEFPIVFNSSIGS